MTLDEGVPLIFIYVSQPKIDYNQFLVEIILTQGSFDIQLILCKQGSL